MRRRKAGVRANAWPAWAAWAAWLPGPQAGRESGAKKNVANPRLHCHCRLQPATMVEATHMVQGFPIAPASARARPFAMAALWAVRRFGGKSEFEREAFCSPRRAQGVLTRQGVITEHAQSMLAGTSRDFDAAMRGLQCCVATPATPPRLPIWSDRCSTTATAVLRCERSCAIISSVRVRVRPLWRSHNNHLCDSPGTQTYRPSIQRSRQAISSPQQSWRPF